MMTAILKSAIFDSAVLYKKIHSFILTQLDDGSYLEFCHVGFCHLSFSSQTHLHLPRLVPNICTKKIHSFILTQLDDDSYLELCHHGFSDLAQRKLHSFILTQLDDGSHLEFCHAGFRSAILDSVTLLSSLGFTQKHSHSILTLTQTNSIWLKLIHSHLTWWWQPSWTLPGWIFFHLGFSHLSFPLRLLTLAKIDSHYLHRKNFTCSFWLNLMIAAIMNSSMSDWASAILDSDTLLSSLGFTQKHSHSTLTLTQTNSIWLKLIHSHLTWWWQPYCILPSWILPSWIQPFSSNSDSN